VVGTSRLVYTLKKSQQLEVTKRKILSEISEIFDPLGPLSPYIIIVKLLLQDLWLHKLTWDESLLQDLHSKWISFHTQLKDLRQVTIARHVVCKEHKSNYMALQTHHSLHTVHVCIYKIIRYSR